MSAISSFSFSTPSQIKVAFYDSGSDTIELHLQIPRAGLSRVNLLRVVLLAVQEISRACRAY